MSTMSAVVGSGHRRRPTRSRAVRAPKQMGLPSELTEVLSHLTDAGRQEFVAELAQGFVEAQDTNDLRPLMEVLEAWYRTLLVRQHPRYQEMMDLAEHTPAKEAIDTDEVRRRIGLAG